MKQIQATDGHVYKVKEHVLANKEVSTRFGNAVILGIRVDAKSAREAYAFAVRFEHGYTCLMSRSEFKLIDKGELTK